MSFLRPFIVPFLALILISACDVLPGSTAMAAEVGLQAQIPMPWDQPPPEFKEMEKRGFHDGVQAAIADFNHHREPDPERHKQFRDPHVKRSFVEDYRKGFRRGYGDAIRHMQRSKGQHS